MSLQFECNDRKAILNIEKHGIDFETATTVLKDPLAYIFDDTWHSISFSDPYYWTRSHLSSFINLFYRKK